LTGACPLYQSFAAGALSWLPADVYLRPEKGLLILFHAMSRTRPGSIELPPQQRQRADGKRPCAVPGCREAGEYRAPVSRNRLRSYYWFCLDHVRGYNQAWDYFAGMNEAAIEAQRRFDTVWQRPSWPLGGGNRPEAGSKPSRTRWRDDFDFFGDPQERDPAKGEAATRSFSSETQKALALLGLEETATWEEIKHRYKTLAKKLHPDANGGDDEAEERLKLINQAYTTLKIDFAATPGAASS
jgi:hypothetical protein